jgi:hypothetical protein
VKGLGASDWAAAGDVANQPAATRVNSRVLPFIAILLRLAPLVWMSCDGRVTQRKPRR